MKDDRLVVNARVRAVLMEVKVVATPYGEVEFEVPRWFNFARRNMATFIESDDGIWLVVMPGRGGLWGYLAVCLGACLYILAACVASEPALTILLFSIGLSVFCVTYWRYVTNRSNWRKAIQFSVAYAEAFQGPMSQPSEDRAS